MAEKNGAPRKLNKGFNAANMPISLLDMPR